MKALKIIVALIGFWYSFYIILCILISLLFWLNFYDVANSDGMLIVGNILGGICSICICASLDQEGKFN